MPQIDLSAWREHVNQGCTIGGKHVGVGESAFPSPCTSCICTNEGVSHNLISFNLIIYFYFLATMCIFADHRLLSISTWMAKRDNFERWRLCCSMWLSPSKYKFSKFWSTSATNWSSAKTSSLTKATTKLTHILFLPRISLPWPHTVYFRLMMRNIRIIL